MSPVTGPRNIAIIAHVDHGKTTLVDQLLRQSGTLQSRGELQDRILDSNDLERERGITILAKNTAILWRDTRINIVDTPGHADFGGEVERALSMVDSVLLLVDAVEGPMPQTRFVTKKALAAGFKPMVVINKVDRQGARPHWVSDRTLDLFDRLGASEEQLDFPIVYASAIEGWASLVAEERGTDMSPLFQTILDHVKAPITDLTAPFRMRVGSLDYSPYTGVIGIGRIDRGTLTPNTQVTVVSRDGSERPARILKVHGFHGLSRYEAELSKAGEIVAVTGVDALSISDTLCDPKAIDPLPVLAVDEPTMSMTFQVNDSPFGGKEGKFVTSRKLRERLMTELIHNVALRVEESGDSDKFNVSGRGEMHLSILIENMRREGYELAVSPPRVIFKEEDGKQLEPYEQLVVDVEVGNQGSIMERLGERRGELRDIMPDGEGRVRLDYLIPSRGLLGFQTEFRTLTSGTGIMHHVFDHYGPVCEGGFSTRRNGVLISNGQGRSVAFALFNLQNRGRLFIGPGEDVYSGLIVGIHSRDNDLTVNPMKGKQLTNIRAAGSDENVILTPPLRLTLEQALDFIEQDELVEVTPRSLRLRKRFLLEHERKKASRQSEASE